MSEWWTYRPEDFLLFSPRVYWRMFELANAAWWPLPLATAAGLVVLAVLATLRPPGYGRLVPLGLAAAWAFVGWAFVHAVYTPINWAAAYAAPLFGVEAVLLLLGSATGRLAFDRRGPAAWAGRLLVALAVLQPLFAPLAGRPLSGGEVFAMAPDPTAIATLGFLLMARGSRLRLVLMALPIAWCLASAATLWTMGATEGVLPLAAAGIALFAPFLPARLTRSSRDDTPA